MVLSSEKYGAALGEMRLAIQGWINIPTSLIYYLDLSVSVVSWYVYAHSFILCAWIIYSIHLENWRVHLVRYITS